MLLHRLPNDTCELGRTRLLGDLSKRELAVVSRFGTTIDCEAGAPLRSVYAAPGQIVVIVSGHVSATTPDGRSRDLGPGDCFGSLPLPAADATLEAFAAATRAALFVVSRNELAGLRERCPRLAARLVHEIATAPEPESVPGPVPGTAPTAASAPVDVRELQSTS